MLGKLITLLFISSLTVGASVAAADTGKNRIEAIANDRVILKSDLDKYESEYLKKMKTHLSQEQIPDRQIIRRQALDQLINSALVEQLAEKMGVSISDVHLDQMMETAAKINGTTVQKLYEESFRRDGLTPAQTREKFRKEALLSEFQSINVRKRIKISNQEIDRMVEMLKKEQGYEVVYRIADIFLRLESTMSPSEIGQVEQLANDIANRIKKGENFGKLAAQYSQDDKASDGGEWEETNINSLPTMFTNHLVGAKEGDIIGPFRIDSGYVIIKVIKIKGHQYTPDLKLKLRHILIKPTVILSDSKVVEKLNEIRARIANNESDFAMEAHKYSEDPATAVNGGDLEMQNPDVFDPLFAQNVKTLKIGEISSPFKSSYGWHIAQLLDKKVDMNSQSALKDKAFEILFSKRYNEELIFWLNELRNQSYIKILDEDLQNLHQSDDTSE